MRQVLPARVLLPLFLFASAMGGSSCMDSATEEGEELQGGSLPATATLARVAITTIPGGAAKPGTRARFVNSSIRVGNGDGAPALSNSVLSSFPGAPAKPLFVGQDKAFDDVLVAIKGRSGFFVVPVNDSIIGLDLVSSKGAAEGDVVTVLVATRRNGKVSAPAQLRLLIDSRIFLAAGDLENHDTDGSNIADLFAPFLEGNQGFPAVPEQVLEGEDNNDVLDGDGVKGLDGTQATGHREVVWDGVPQKFVNLPDFSPEFFNRLDSGSVGVRGGIVFKAAGGTGEEVNDALDGVIPDINTPPVGEDEDAPLGGDFSNINRKFAGNLLSFTQSAQFATLGTVVTDITFKVPGNGKKATVTGLGIVFSSVDRGGKTSVEYFDEQGRSIIKIFSPVQSKGPFPFPGPVAADRFPYTFVGFLDPDKRIARVRVTAGEVPIDKASDDLPVGNKDVVAFDDVYYAEPQQ